MSLIEEIWVDIRTFFKALSAYVFKRGSQLFFIFEVRKDLLVEVLTAKRGLYQRPFLHGAFIVLAVLGILVIPLVANNGLTQAKDQLDSITPPSAVLSSFDEQDTFTQISEKPRDKELLYKVEDKDTISSIGEKFGVSSDSIKWANSSTIKGDYLKVGQEIKIPPVSGVVHKVQKGDTIYTVAKKYKVDAQNIVNYPFNDFADLDTFALTIGQTLVVPDGVMPEAKPIFTPQQIADVGNVQSSGQFIWPTKGIVTQRPASYHMAFDIANNALPPVVAADDGVVSSVNYDKYGYGNHIIVSHANGYQTLYGHLTEAYVNAGQKVAKGSVIGKMGSTGRSTGPHLHFEIRLGGKLLNPANFLK